ncbi:MAG: DUF3127 domain-containing protein [Bacteroidales bacterium]|nr:DUF3127 domain-containing protein [Bacteroidales bacterium]
MELTGKIILVQPEQTGITSAGKQWRRRTYVIEFVPENSQFEHHMAFDVWNENIDKLNMVEGGTYLIGFDVDARKWNDRYFNNITVWRATETTGFSHDQLVSSNNNGVVPPVNESAPILPQQTELPTDNNENSDLPF